MNLKDLLPTVAAVVVSVLVVGVFFSPEDGRPGRDGKDGALGAMPGPEVYDHMVFQQNFTKGGDIVSTSSAANTVLTTQDFNENVNLISFTPNVAAVTVTTMASSAAPFANMRAGDSLDVLFYNASTSASAVVTLAAGTGVDLQEDEGATVTINGLEVARLTFVKKSDTDIIAWAEVGQVGD